MTVEERVKRLDEILEKYETGPSLITKEEREEYYRLSFGLEEQSC